ncbi:hypothetical protein M3Y99_00505500 [Aphelenchoides fujianensis]|nr:hypothetical protein M3Y99_00505500 [Aphelenchoides fujianensis]
MPLRRLLRCAAQRQPNHSFAALGVGICLGIFLGSQSEVDQRFIASLPQSSSTFNETAKKREVWIRTCNRFWNTYSKRCNKTVFFTSEEKLLARFHAKRFKTRLPSAFDQWTIFLNEQNYVIPQNLRLLVENHDTNEPIVWILSYLFPFLQTEMFQIDAGVIVSRRALESIATADKCRPHWFIPVHTGKGLFACGMQTNLRLIDPVDEEGYHLLLADNLRNMFSSKYFTALEGSFKVGSGNQSGMLQ